MSLEATPAGELAKEKIKGIVSLISGFVRQFNGWVQNARMPQEAFAPGHWL
jgi:hypothetical protein